MKLIQILKALSDENRIRILNILKDEELCVGEIEHILGINQSNASRHLNKLSSLNIITYEKKAQWVYYKLDEKICEEYPFIKSLLSIELSKIDECNKDNERLYQYKNSGMTCANLKECQAETNDECNCKKCSK